MWSGMWVGRIIGVCAALSRWLVPAVVIMLAFVLEHLPVEGTHTQALVPMFSVMSIIAFSIRKMAVMPPWFVFLLSLWAELYAGAIPGTLTIPMMVVRFILIEQREFFLFAPFFAVWAGASVLLFLFSALHFLAIVGFYVSMFDPTILLIRTCMSIALYPVVAGLVYWVDLVLWPHRRQSSQVNDFSVQFLPAGMRLPRVVTRKNQNNEQDNTGDAVLKNRSVFRRIRKSKTAKPWMEL